ncbi:MAG: hypothetical protein ACK5DD_14130 [Cyclobacteriaceae bacterium]|jgi:protein TonB
MSDEEKKNRNVGLLVTVGFHAVLALLFFFLMAWRAPNPPLPEYGIVLNFGISEEGSGAVQEPVPTSPQEETAAEETEEQQEPEAEPEKTEPEVNEEKAADEVPKTPSPVTVKEEKKEMKKEAPKVTPEEKKDIKPKTETKKSEPTTDKKTTDTDQKTSDTEGKPTSQGDDTGKKGDKGNPEGVPDPNAQYTGKPGGGGGGDGMSLNMGGWAWADKPTIPDLPDDAGGFIEFEIKCDQNGEITGIKTNEKTLSLQAERMLREAIMRSSLQYKAAGQAPSESTGKVRFVLKVD